jgi:hypothetical protein
MRGLAMKRGLRLIPSAGVLLLVLGIMFSASAADPIQVTPLPPVETTDGRAGVCYSYYDDPLGNSGRPFIPLVYDAGSRWDRFDFAWPSLEPQEGVWNFGPHEGIVADLQAGGIVNIIGILQMTPQWAASKCAEDVREQSLALLEASRSYYPPGPGAFSTSLRPQDTWEDPWPRMPPRGLYEEWHDWNWDDDDPVNYWGRFVYHTVDYYSERGVKYWEMWNEPEWDLFWCGTSVDYARLLEVGYLATKSACSDCKVLFGGLHYWENPNYYKWVLNTLRNQPDAQENNYFFDIMSVHLYSRSSDVHDKVNEIKTGMAVRMMDHPVWLTETGVPIWGDSYGWVSARPKYRNAASVDQAAAHVIQTYANAWSAGVERYFFFRASDDWCDKNRDGDCTDEGIDGGMTELFGLVRDNHAVRPSYLAYRVAASYLISPTKVQDTSNGGIRVVSLLGTPRGKVSVLWNTTSNSLPYDHPAILPTATRVSMEGDREAVAAADGAYALTLPGATANWGDTAEDYFIGGEQYLIIEEDTVPPSGTSLEPLPATTYSTTIPISWSASDDQAGIWGVEVQVRAEGEGDWSNWLGILDTEETWSADYDAGQHGDDVYPHYCFRARAWDRAGNIGPWSEEERCTRLDLDRVVHVNVGAVFGDEDGDGEQDSSEAALDNVSFRFFDRLGSDVATPGCGASWEITTTLRAGEYAILIEPQGWPSPPGGWLPRRETIDLRPGEAVWELDRPAIGLLRHRSSSYLPLVARDS